ncbi:T7SS effector LXG polymorphic toxin [Streptococcus oricebi]|uniref:LXG domain-containing protein n=1 Tax=Streptococcus oricebi TaxID=1547447 RepID=A0ABS5B7R6_9STRE|nr:T7SS effector LXG polymorphic toxin [Streptococcus oricebi]MBP2624064.1 hypothetical protein [Streptococcus oricebi]
MGLKYSSSDSQTLMTNLANNIESAKATVANLNSASQALTNSVSNGELKGAAYTAASGLFSDTIIPTINRATTVFNSINANLDSYKNYDATMPQGEVLDEDKLTQMKLTKQALKAATDASSATLSLGQGLPGVGDDIKKTVEGLNSYSSSLQGEIDEIEAKLQKLRDFSNNTSSLFSSSLADLGIVMQSLAVLNNTQVNANTGAYTLPSGTNLTWFNSLQASNAQGKSAGPAPTAQSQSFGGSLLAGLKSFFGYSETTTVNGPERTQRTPWGSTYTKTSTSTTYEKKGVVNGQWTNGHFSGGSLNLGIVNVGVDASGGNLSFTGSGNIGDYGLTSTTSIGSNGLDNSIGMKAKNVTVSSGGNINPAKVDEGMVGLYTRSSQTETSGGGLSTTTTVESGGRSVDDDQLKTAGEVVAVAATAAVVAVALPELLLVGAAIA